MTSRNLTEVFGLMRNNARSSRNMYADETRVSYLKFPDVTQINNIIVFEQQSESGDGERLLGRRSLHDAEEGLELRGDDCGAPPVWTDKLEETQYTLSKCVNLNWLIYEILLIVYFY